MNKDQARASVLRIHLHQEIMLSTFDACTLPALVAGVMKWRQKALEHFGAEGLILPRPFGDGVGFDS